ncbi:glycogenin-1-like [Artemia franciscana]|uniref:glycogenin glucosyltransferase n=1 Tax=Artemia franciscana TaxID=6661 RepID=A0AA88IDM3_ARTSF|nr:hypothetical protein QYM36_004797 [Artemia franciscana]
MAEGWVTLATNETYCVGALVLANSLKRVATRGQLAILITPDVSQLMRRRLQEAFDVVEVVDVLDSQDSAHLALLARPELGITFTKIHAWKLTQFKTAVFLDADTLVVQNCDELFDKEELSAVSDPGWPDCFNSGVFVFKPSENTYNDLIGFATNKGSFDGGDQGLLNSYFSNWQYSDISKHLSFIYNMASSASYFYRPAYKEFGGNVKIVHFIGSPKPWQQNFSVAGQHQSEHLQLWWTLFFRYVQPQLSEDMEEVVCNRHWLRLTPLYTLSQTPRPLPDIHHPSLDRPSAITDITNYVVLEQPRTLESLPQFEKLPQLTQDTPAVTLPLENTLILQIDNAQPEVVQENILEVIPETLPSVFTEVENAVPETHEVSFEAYEVKAHEEGDEFEDKGLAGCLSQLPMPTELESPPTVAEEQPEAVPSWKTNEFNFDRILARINKTLSELGEKEVTPDSPEVEATLDSAE